MVNVIQHPAFVVISMMCCVNFSRAQADLNAAQAAPSGGYDSLLWDATEQSVTNFDARRLIEFVFVATNGGDSEVIIRRAETSCGCTVAKLPSVPWSIASHSKVELSVFVDIGERTGLLENAVTLVDDKGRSTILKVRVSVLQTHEMFRAANRMIAIGDRQALFRNECAKCHADADSRKDAATLYVGLCGICHDANSRASMVPKLDAVRHANDLTYWKDIITYGKPLSLMPAFGQAEGGPLNDKQIELLAKYLSGGRR